MQRCFARAWTQSTSPPAPFPCRSRGAGYFWACCWWLCSALSRHLDACSAPATSSANGAGANREGSTPADARANEAVEVLRCVAWGGHDELRALATGAGLTPAALAEALATSPATSAAVMPSHPRRRNRPQ